MEKKNYVTPSQKVRKIRVQSMLAGSVIAGGDDKIPTTPAIGQGPANPGGGMMARKRSSLD